MSPSKPDLFRPLPHRVAQARARFPNAIHHASKAKPSKALVEPKVPATQVKSKFSKEAAKYTVPSRIPLTQIAEQVMRLVKEEGFDKEDAVNV